MKGGVRVLWLRMCPPACPWDGQRSAQPSDATCAGLDSCSEGYLCMFLALCGGKSHPGCLRALHRPHLASAEP